MQLKVGDIVIVKDHVVDADSQVAMSGWQGQITGIQPQFGMASVAFDNPTIRSIPESFVTEREARVLAWDSYLYKLSDLELVHAAPAGATRPKATAAPPSQYEQQMSQPMNSAPYNNQTGRSSCLTNVLWIFLAIFFLTVGFFAATFYTGVYAVNKTVTEPVQQLIKNIGINATPEVRPDPVTIVREINNLAQLQTAEYKMEKIITAEGGSDSFLGIFEDELIFVAVGQVTAGIDLAKMTQADIQAVTFQTVTIRLPESEIFISTLDNELSYVADRDVGPGTRLLQPDPELETLARRAGEEAIHEAALNEGILDIADTNAKRVLEGLLKSLGFQAVVFVDGELPPPIEYDPEIPKGFIEQPGQ